MRIFSNRENADCQNEIWYKKSRQQRLNFAAERQQAVLALFMI